MKVLIIGMVGVGNLGDDLISSMLITNVRKRWPASEVGLVVRGPVSSMLEKRDIEIFYLQTPKRSEFGSFLKRSSAIKYYARNADLILVGGGGLFQDTHYLFTSHKWLSTALATSFSGNPISIVGAGFGPIKYGFTHWYLKHALHRISCIQVRDQSSRAIVARLGHNTILGPDIVAGSDLSGVGFQDSSNKSSTRHVLGCSIRPWPGVSFDAVLNLIIRLSKHGDSLVKIFVFEHCEPYNTSEFDYATLLEASLRKRGVSVEVYCYERCAWSAFIDAFCSVHEAVASRFHANILWQKINVPVIPLSYAPKVTDLYAERGLDQSLVNSIDQSPFSEQPLTIELDDEYSLPPTEQLLRVSPYSPTGLKSLGVATEIGEWSYGSARSLFIRAKRTARYTFPSLKH